MTMTWPIIHLRSGVGTVDGVRMRSVCGKAVANWTDDVQAVTCDGCVAKMELQPA